MRLALLDCEDVDDEKTRQERWKEGYGVEGDVWEVFRCYLGHVPDSDDWERLDGAVVTSSVHEATEEKAWIVQTAQAVRNAVRTGRVRVLASCFGCQLMAVAMGGRLATCREPAYVLQVDQVRPTTTMQTSPMCRGWNAAETRLLTACTSHVVVLPRGAVLLATATTTRAAIWTDGRALLAWQLRPEMDVEGAKRSILPLADGRMRLEDRRRLEHATNEDADGAKAFLALGRRFLHGQEHGWMPRDVKEAEEEMRRAARALVQVAKRDALADETQRTLAMNLAAAERLERVRDAVLRVSTYVGDVKVAREKCQRCEDTLECAEQRVSALEVMVDGMLRRADALESRLAHA
eukprot:scaffold155_cov347-Pavlova_lutheri.AAC.11